MKRQGPFPPLHVHGRGGDEGGVVLTLLDTHCLVPQWMRDPDGFGLLLFDQVLRSLLHCHGAHH
jgi:hypothetical protein